MRFERMDAAGIIICETHGLSPRVTPKRPRSRDLSLPYCMCLLYAYVVVTYVEYCVLICGASHNTRRHKSTFSVGVGLWSLFHRQTLRVYFVWSCSHTAVAVAAIVWQYLVGVSCSYAFVVVLL